MHRVVRRRRRVRGNSLDHAAHAERNVEPLRQPLLELRALPVLPERAREIVVKPMTTVPPSTLSSSASFRCAALPRFCVVA